MCEAPVVSVIMTVYNGEQYLEDALQSICQQTLRNFECIVVDDGSSDRTPEILARYAELGLVRLIQVERLGRIRSLNLAWQSARGAYIANLDADDLALPTRLEAQLSYMQKNPAVGVLGSDCGLLRDRSESDETVVNVFEDADIRRTFTRRNPIVHSSVMIRRTALVEAGGYDQSLAMSEDYDLWVRIARRWRVENMPVVLTLKRRHAQATFQQKKYSIELHQTRMQIRWRAWRTLSRSFGELPFVLEPLLKWLYIKANQRPRLV